MGDTQHLMADSAPGDGQEPTGADLCRLVGGCLGRRGSRVAGLMAGGPCLLHSATGACPPLPWGVAPESPLRGRSPTWLQTSPYELLREVPSVTGQRSRGPGSPLRLHGERAQKSRSRLCGKGVRSREVLPLTPERLRTCCVHSSKESPCRGLTQWFWELTSGPSQAEGSGVRPAGAPGCHWTPHPTPFSQP